MEPDRAEQRRPLCAGRCGRRTADGKAADQVTVAQEVIPAVPVEVWAGTLAQVGGDTSIMIQPPAGALAGFGVVDVRLSDTLAPPLAGVRGYMAAYPYSCFEQRLSKAIALDDAGAWTALAGDMPTYQAPDGLLRYFPSDTMHGVGGAVGLCAGDHQRGRAAIAGGAAREADRGAEGGARRADAQRDLWRRAAAEGGDLRGPRAGRARRPRRCWGRSG